MANIRHFMDPRDFSLDEYDKLFKVAENIIADPKKFSSKGKGKILATLFFEPSTRTRLSFETAMLKLGGSVIGFSDISSSSGTKGESVADTLKVVSGYADIITIRHPIAYAPQEAVYFCDVPVINAGDGGNQHPTQTLTDLLTISSKFNRLDNLTIGICGDLKFGRTVHSLITAMSLYKGNKFVMISPEELQIPDSLKESLDENGVDYVETTDLDESIGSLDILYMTRIQRERFAYSEDYARLKDAYILDMNKMDLAKEDMIVLHPLPRVNEISVEVDFDPRAYYFKQATNGVYARMALIMKLLGLK